MSGIDLMHPAFLLDPYPTYSKLRSLGSLVYYSPWELWLATDYESCVDLLRSNDVGHGLQADYGKSRLSTQTYLNELQKTWLLLHDPPTHTRLRLLMGDCFSPRRLDAIELLVKSASDQLITNACRLEDVDIMTNVATQLPILVIAELFGIPVSDRYLVARWSSAIAATLEFSVHDDLLAAGSRAAFEFSQYLQDLISEKNRNPSNDLLSMLIHSTTSVERITEAELLSNCIMLIVAGHETSINFLGNAILALLKNPDQLNHLRANPGLVKVAIEELLRFDSPVQTTTRIVLRDIVYKGVDLRASSRVAFLLGSANHDSSVFASPELLLLSRDPNPHLSFSHGIHYCLGAYLARLEGRILIQSLIEHSTELTLLDNDPDFRKSWSARGLNRLNVRIRT